MKKINFNLKIIYTTINIIVTIVTIVFLAMFSSSLFIYTFSKFDIMAVALFIVTTILLILLSHDCVKKVKSVYEEKL